MCYKYLYIYNYIIYYISLAQVKMLVVGILLLANKKFLKSICMIKYYK